MERSLCPVDIFHEPENRKRVFVQGTLIPLKTEKRAELGTFFHEPENRKRVYVQGH